MVVLSPGGLSREGNVAASRTGGGMDVFFDVDMGHVVGWIEVAKGRMDLYF